VNRRRVFSWPAGLVAASAEGIRCIEIVVVVVVVIISIIIIIIVIIIKRLDTESIQDTKNSIHKF
jgi:K+ transporter